MATGVHLHKVFISEGNLISHPSSLIPHPSSLIPHPQFLTAGQAWKLLDHSAKILQESWSILSHETQWNGIFADSFQQLAAMFVFWQSETIVQAKMKTFHHVLRNKMFQDFWCFLTIFSLSSGFYAWPAILKAEKDLGTRLQ